MKKISLKRYGIKNATVSYQKTASELHKITIEKGMGKEVTSEALAINTGTYTGRSPMDRFIVKDTITKDQVWWGDINLPISSADFDRLHKKMCAYFEGREIYVRDCFACAAKEFQTSIRVINEYPWSNLFVYNMFIRPNTKELIDFSEDWIILNAPGFKANPKEDGTRQANFSIINFSKKVILIGGTGYTGEIKKGIFSALNFILPLEKSVLPMHCSANTGAQGDTALFFGLSGTGKTTLSADVHRKLIGDDEHGWTSNDCIFNFEGGCYAKVIGLSHKKEPEIFEAIKKGALLENVRINNDGSVDFDDTSITENTRVSYPIDHIENSAVPSLGSAPKNIFFLTADAFGVLPPISKLTASQAAYHFISGYTAKVAGTEEGVLSPSPHFSACFGAPFMPLHPTKYAEMLQQKLKKLGTNIWLINTGWTGGPYGVGSRIKLKFTRAMINAVMNGELGLYNYDDYHIHSVFGVAQPRKCSGVPTAVLSPRTTWNNDENYYKAAFKLSNAFRENFKKYEIHANEEIRRGGPQRYTF